MDTCTINSIDETNLGNGYVIVNCTVIISGTTYSQIYTSYNTDPISIAADVKNQAEQFKATIINNSTLVNDDVDTIQGLDGTVIDL